MNLSVVVVLAAVAAAAATCAARHGDGGGESGDERDARVQREHRDEALARRVAAANYQLAQPYASLRGIAGGESNDARYAFAKLLEHDAATGELTADGAREFERLVAALERGDVAALGTVRLAVPPAADGAARRVLINPAAAFSFDESGADVGQVALAAPPAMRSAHGVAELVEVYAMALLRDVPFDAYASGTEARVDAALRALNALGAAYDGPRAADGRVTAHELFRGTTAGDAAGHYVSQFALLPLLPLFPSGCAPFVGELTGVGALPLGALMHEQRVPMPADTDFVDTWAEYVAVQRGELPRVFTRDDYESERRYVTTGRALGGVVHVDSPYEAYYHALNVLVFRGAPASPVLPYAGSSGNLANQGSGHTFGAPDAYTLMARAAIAAFRAAWAHKWRAYRRARPEVMAARVERTLRTDAALDAALRAGDGAALRAALANYGGANPHGLALDALLGAPDVRELLAQYALRNAAAADADRNTLLLSQMYPEGSPAHPAYPSGHATVAGACTTVLKAFFDTDAAIPSLPTDDGANGIGYEHGHFPVGAVRIDHASDTAVPLDDATAARLTVGGELDKLASNIAHGRDFGGVHYRADGDEGMALGERVALRLLQDHARTYAERQFTHFRVPLRDGRVALVSASRIAYE
mmetsp:Transcript_28415/g.69119  ORF Transcript_28415/g.69119 Transcript_28415/m.69119 type:complete len:647 (-) Transcript_28415:79-2019(-)